MKTFEIGQKLKILPDRIMSHQPRGELTVVGIWVTQRHDEGVGHHQVLTMDNGRYYSGWWFDDETPALPREHSSTRGTT